MALNNIQYDTIMRDYQRTQAEHRHEQEDRIQEVFQKLPQIKEMNDQIAALSVQSARDLLSGDSMAVPRLKKQISELGQKRRNLLRKEGYPEDYLDLTYTCPDCKDTGYIENKKCHCFRQAEIDLLYTQSNLCEVLKTENFDHFSFSYYSDQIIDTSSQISSLERIKKIYKICQNFVEQFDARFDNLFLYGDTGVGKTFLSHCIARELLNTTHSVIYFSAQDLFENFAAKRFQRNPEDIPSTDYIYDCDLLIIDDLGTEMTNSFVNSELFLCINERLVNRKSTIISTNLTLDAFSEVYSERIFSRISNGYTMLKLFGQDIRLQKKLQRLSGKKPLNI